jgi:hypothetical protein
MIVGDVRITGDRARDQLTSFAMSPALVRQQAEQMQSCRVIGMSGQNLPVDRFSLVEAIGAMVIDSEMDRLLKGQRRGLSVICDFRFAIAD